MTDKRVLSGLLRLFLGGVCGLFLCLITNFKVWAQAEPPDDLSLARKHFVAASTFQTNEVLDSAAYYFAEAAKLFHPDRYKNEMDPDIIADLPQIFQNYLLCNNELAACYNGLGRYDEAVTLSLQTLDLAKQKLGNDDHIAAANSYNNIGMAYDYKGQYQKALDNYLRATEILAKLPDSDALQAYVNNNIGAIYAIKEDFDLAERYYKLSLDTKKKLLGSADPALANTYNNLANLYAKQDNYEEAAQYYEKAIKISGSKPTGLDRPRFDLNTGSLAATRQPPDFPKAFQHLRLALNDFSAELGDKAEDLAKAYRYMAFTFLRRGDVLDKSADYDSSLIYAQKALISLSDDFNEKALKANPSVQNVVFERELLEVLLIKAKAFNRRKTPTDYRQALVVADSALKLIHNKRLTADNDKDKEFWSGKFFEISQLAIETAFKLEPINSPTAFTFSELSKAGILLQAMTQIRIHNELKAVSEAISSAISEGFDLIDKATKAKQRISDLKKSLQLEEAKGRKKKKGKIQELKADIEKAEKDYENLRRELEKKKPEYVRPKYEAGKVNPDSIRKFLRSEQVQQGVLKNLPETAVVEYFMGDSALFVFCITAQNYTTYRLPYKRTAFEDTIRQMRKSINLKDNKTYALAAHSLYNKLIRPLESVLTQDNIRHLLIIPDGALCYIPFEALLMRPSEEKANITEYSFLVRKFDIYYNFSAGLVRLQETNKQLAMQDFLAFAPVFSQKKRLTANYASVTALPKSEQELLQIQKLFKELRPNSQPQIYLNLDASEDKTSSDNLSGYKILHFATHGLVYPNNPENSGILLYQDPNEFSDGLWDCAEIMATDLSKTQLVVLSACETGLGQMVKGEGLVGLTRAFLQAGATNVVVSLWPVSDASTAELMIHFYRSLLKNFSLSDALQNAKKELIKEGKFAEPYYWAPFIISGRADLVAQ